MCQIFFKGLFFRAVSGSQQTRGKVQRVPVSPPPPLLPLAPQTVLRGDDEPASTRHSHPDPKPRARRRGCPVWGSDELVPTCSGASSLPRKSSGLPLLIPPHPGSRQMRVPPPSPHLGLFQRVRQLDSDSLESVRPASFARERAARAPPGCSGPDRAVLFRADSRP